METDFQKKCASKICIEKGVIDMINEKLLEILACPVCKKSVQYEKENEKLVCEHCGLKYPVKDGIPVMLESEAEKY